MSDLEHRSPFAGGRTAFKRGPTLDASMFYMGSLMSFLVSGEESRDGFCLMEYSSRPGHEPPPHIHEDHDELLYILEGEVEAYWGGTVLRVAAGECLFLPRAQAHAWYVLSPRLRMLILTQPAGLDDYFRAMAFPAESLELPPASVTYAMDDPARAVRIANQHRIRILTPDDTRNLLPHYPGFPRPTQS